jgi:hypothetical protein
MTCSATVSAWEDESEEEIEEENQLDLLACAFKELEVTTEIEMCGLNDQATTTAKAVTDNGSKSIAQSAMICSTIEWNRL